MANRTAADEERLIDAYIEPDPNRPGADRARIKGYGMNVWALIGEYNATAGDIAAVAGAYDVPVEVVDAALAYYRRHKDAIDCRLAANMV